jgi:hypothetical protein
MAALLATRRKHLAASCGLHARTEPVRLGAPAFARLICALWQSNPPLVTRAGNAKFHPPDSHASTHAALIKQRFTSRTCGHLRIS